jgi:hypothetical protein
MAAKTPSRQEHNQRVVLSPPSLDGECRCADVLCWAPRAGFKRFALFGALASWRLIRQIEGKGFS